jgi:hypothetical protein
VDDDLAAVRAVFDADEPIVIRVRHELEPFQQRLLQAFGAGYVVDAGADPCARPCGRPECAVKGVSLSMASLGRPVVEFVPNWIDYRSSVANVDRREDRGETVETCHECGCETDVTPVPHSPKCSTFAATVDRHEAENGRELLDRMDEGEPVGLEEADADAVGAASETSASSIPKEAFWTREMVIEAIQEWARRHGGRAPTQKEWMRRGEYHPAFSTAAKRFGGWSDARQPYLSTTKDDINDGPLYERLRGYVFQKIEHLLRELKTRREFLVLDDIAFELGRALDPSGGKIPVFVAPVPEFEGGEPPDRETVPGPHRPRPEKPDGDESETDAIARLEMARMSDPDMDGHLCRAEESRGQVAVFINADHSAVKIALEKEPTNRLALALMVLREVAGLLAHNDGLRRTTFSPSQLTKIEAVGEDLREGLIFRTLMDRVHGIEEVAA